MSIEFQKMRSETLYSFADEEVAESCRRAKMLCKKLNQMTIYDDDYRSVIEQLIPNLPKDSTVSPPFFCDHGHGITLGKNVFVNHNCVMLDGGEIIVGNNVLIGPSCQFYTAEHPMDFVQRRLPQETCRKITIGDDTWLCGSVVVCPGVSIGKRCIIAAGAVVTKDIPDDCLAAGVPAVVKKRL